MAGSNRHRLEQRGKVLLSAHKRFIRHGFHATGMAEIAKASRMSVGNIYHYFPRKSAIVQAITDEFRSRMLPVIRPLAEHEDPVEGLVQVMLLCVREIGANSNARLWMEILAEAPRNKVIHTICQAVDRDIRKVLEHLIERAMQAGLVSRDLDLQWSSLWLMALLDGTISRLSLEPDLDRNHTERTLEQNLRRLFRKEPV